MKKLFNLVSKLHMTGTETLTPPELVEEMLDRLPPEVFTDPQKTFLDPACGTGTLYLCLLQRLDEGLKEVIPDREERLAHIMSKQLHACEIDHKQLRRFKAALRHLGLEHFAKNVYNDDSLTREWAMKFDVVVGNPPYQGTLCLKFLRHACDIGNRVLYVMPTTWLLDNKNIFKPYARARALVKDRIQSITLFNGNEQFGIASFLPLGVLDIVPVREGPIVVLDRCNSTILSYETIDDINKFSNISIYPRLLKKYHQACLLLGNIGQHINREGNYYVSFSPIRGHVNTKGITMVADDFYTIITRDLVAENTPRKKSWWSFDTGEEAENFIEYLKTDFARFGLAILKNTQNLGSTDMSCIPWIDPTRSWSNEELYKKFDITPEERDFITQHIPPYYQ